MEGQNLLSDITPKVTSEVPEEPSPVVKEAGIPHLRRDNDSLDDFEHLEHDVSPVKETGDSIAKPDSSSGESPPRVVPEVINTVAKSVAETAHKLVDELKTENFKTPSPAVSAENIATTMSTVTDLLDMGSEDFTSDKTSTDLLSDFSYAPPVPPHADDASKKPFGEVDNFKAVTQSFMDFERDEILAAPGKITSAAVSDLADRFSDSEPEIDDFKPSSNEDFKFSSKADEDASDEFVTSKTADFKPEMFKDVIDEPEMEPELPKRDYFDREPTPVQDPSPEPILFSEVIKSAPEPKPISTPVPAPVAPTPEPERKPVERIELVCNLPKPTAKKNQEVMGAEAMFCKMGLDAWFNPERLNPRVESLIYWRDPRKSGAVFGGTLVVLLSLAYFSLISVTAYLSLLALAGTISFRVYKNVLQAVQKTGDGHPFKELLEADVALPQERVRDVTDVAVTHINAAVCELRRLFLVEDLVDSIKFGVLLWCLTYLGAWFNGMTIVIIAFVALFTLPKVYENNKTQIDANLDIVRTKLAEITSKVKAAVPIGKKTEEKKEQ